MIELDELVREPGSLVSQVVNDGLEVDASVYAGMHNSVVLVCPDESTIHRSTPRKWYRSLPERYS